MRAASDLPSTGTPSSLAYIMRTRSSGRGRLLVCVVRNPWVLLFMNPPVAILRNAAARLNHKISRGAPHRPEIERAVAGVRREPQHARSLERQRPGVRGEQRGEQRHREEF